MTRNIFLKIRLTPAEKDAYSAAAQAKGVSVSQLVREAFADYLNDPYVRAATQAAYDNGAVTFDVSAATDDGADEDELPPPLQIDFLFDGDGETTQRKKSRDGSTGRDWTTVEAASECARRDPWAYADEIVSVPIIGMLDASTRLPVAVTP